MYRLVSCFVWLRHFRVVVPPSSATTPRVSCSSSSLFCTAPFTSTVSLGVSPYIHAEVCVLYLRMHVWLCISKSLRLCGCRRPSRFRAFISHPFGIREAHFPLGFPRPNVTFAFSLNPVAVSPCFHTPSLLFPPSVFAVTRRLVGCLRRSASFSPPHIRDAFVFSQNELLHLRVWRTPFSSHDGARQLLAALSAVGFLRRDPACTGICVCRFFSFSLAEALERSDCMCLRSRTGLERRGS